MLRLPDVDAGGGWLIFGLPPSELAVHPAENGGRQAIYLMVEDMDRFATRMAESGVACSAVHEEPWGRLVEITVQSKALATNERGAAEPRCASRGTSTYRARMQGPPGPRSAGEARAKF